MTEIIKTVIFLGPTLSLTEAEAILPSAFFHPPIQCGDLLRLMRFKPQSIGIIDGYYESCGAVWHKEILLAIEQGITVYGASSMGALRAAELYHYGMVGVGTIFEWFKKGELEDDDEVAVIHEDAARHFKPVNDVMVNVRATLKAALTEKMIEPHIAEEIITIMKNTFYPNRNLLKTCETIEKQQHVSLAVFKQWLAAGNFVDQKKRDAILLLEQINHSVPLSSSAPPVVTEKTRFLKKIHNIILQTPHAECYSWLPEQEKKIYELSKKQPEKFKLIQSLSSLLSVCLNSAIKEIQDISPDSLKKYVDQHHLIDVNHYFSSYLVDPVFKPLTQWMQEKICLLRLTSEELNQWYLFFKALQPFSINEIDDDLILGLHQHAILFACLNHTLAHSKNYFIKSNFYIKIIKNLQETLGLETAEQTAIWMQTNNLNLDEVTLKLLAWARYKIMMQTIAPDLITFPQVLPAVPFLAKACGGMSQLSS